jgi:PIN domain nuclease of toxin-antitoxin system
VRLLLDTHIALWAILDDERLPRTARELIEDLGNDVLVSAASVWEIAIKHALARGHASDMPISGPAALAYFRSAGYELLAISADHAAAISALPPLHADPFDRMLVAQAQTEPLRLVTHDARLAQYGGPVMLV